MKKGIYFGALLQELMLQAGIKNTVLSEALQYDVSYISKWVSGRLLPSEKNIGKVAERASACIVDSAPEDVEERLYLEYGALDKAMLCAKLEHALMEAYRKDKCSAEDSQERLFYDCRYLTVTTMQELVRAMRFSKEEYSFPDEEIEIAAVIDVMSLDHESRLLLAGIEKHRFALSTALPKVHFSLLLYVDPEGGGANQDCVYDSIFLIHMLTSLSKIHFQLYNHFSAFGKAIYAVKDGFFVTGMLFGKEEQCLSFIKGKDRAAANELYREMKTVFSQETLIFRKSSIGEMLENKDYFQSLIATGLCWLLGHMTELFLPEDLFEELLCRLPDDWKDRLADMRRSHTIVRNILEISNARIMIYESAFSDFVLTGELDFFNHRMHLTIGQRLRCLRYFSEFIYKNNSERIQLIDGGFSSDFRYITNPCMFMSDALCYLRLENGDYENNILILNDKAVRNIFSRFYQEIWTNRSDVVEGTPDVVREKVAHLIKFAEVLEKNE